MEIYAFIKDKNLKFFYLNTSQDLNLSFSINY